MKKKNTAHNKKKRKTSTQPRNDTDCRISEQAHKKLL